MVQVRDPDRYQVINEHGRGGLGRVLRAHDRQLGRDVAIKELISRGDIGEVRFLREALITARLEHPGIVPVHEAGRWPDGTPFYAMKLVAGRPLRALIAACSDAQRATLLPHVIAVADAIAYAHGRNIIHRDLKPANVIVGDFGETVVIDWGLAKDLSSRDPSFDGGPYRGSGGGDPELTTAGSVLGTPAYMAPEQERGEQVDQRADVFAIGAMLWELFGPRKVHCSELAQHRRAMRKAGVDPDLIAIMEKSLAAEPSRRYADAGALAADLKAFVAGGRVAARRYSLLDLLTHWTRQHRALAIGALVALAVALVAAALFVRGITRERDRADEKADEAIRHQRAAELANDALTLQHAELLLVTDPTAAHQLLAGYRGVNRERADLLRARAEALGVAKLWLPGDNQIERIAALPDGTLLTLSANTLVKTRLDGVRHELAHDASRAHAMAVGTAGFVAYGCNPVALCLIDAVNERVQPQIATGAPINDLAFSPSGRQLATITSSGRVTVWRVGNNGVSELRHHQLASGVLVRFADEDTLIAAAQDHVEVLAAHGDRVALRDATAIESHAGMFAIAGAHGELAVGAPGHWKTLTLCTTALNDVAFAPAHEALAFACQDGRVGVLDMHTLAPRFETRIEGGVADLAVAGDQLVLGETNGAVGIYNLATRRLEHRRGHKSRVVSVAGVPGGIASGDVDGTLAVWPAASAAIESVLTPSDRPLMAVALPGGTLLATGASVSWQRGAEGGQLVGHDAKRAWLAYHRQRPEVVMYGSDDTIERWDFAATPTHTLLRTGHGTVSAVRFPTGRDYFVSAGSDGRLVAWPGGKPQVITTLDEPIRLFASAPGDQFAVLGASGKLWRVTGGQRSLLESNVGAVLVSMEGRWIVAMGMDSTAVFDTTTWQRAAISLPTGVRSLTFGNHDRELAVRTADGVSRIALDGGTAAAGLAVSARSLSYAPDGAWLAASGSDGLLWLWSRATGAWSAHAVSSSALENGSFSPDARHYLVSDAGHVFRVDLAALAQERTR